MRSLLILIICLPALSLKAQMTLEISYYRPLSAGNSGYLEEDVVYVLLTDQQRSLFTALPAETGADYRIGRVLMADISFATGGRNNWVYKDLSAALQTQLIVTVQDNRYLSKEVMHPMAWKIFEETRELEGITVQKARCFHRGRYYNAWFAPAIPISNGPWKLGGLPGLILEAYDDQCEVVFLFGALRYRPDQPPGMPQVLAREVSTQTSLRLMQEEFRQYLDLIETRLEAGRRDMEIDLQVRKCEPWEYPDNY